MAQQLTMTINNLSRSQISFEIVARGREPILGDLPHRCWDRVAVPAAEEYQVHFGDDVVVAVNDPSAMVSFDGQRGIVTLPL